MNSTFLTIYNSEQWLQIRGEDAQKPVVLVLHGGPGVSYIPFASCFAGWDKDFNVVHWDQRGAGKTFSRSRDRSGKDLTIERMVQDGIAVAEYLNQRFGKKIALLAHSWGSILGLQMAAQRPDLFELYLGAGQVISMPKGEALSYQLLLSKIQNPKSKKALEELGPPPYAEIKKWMVKQRLIVMNDPTVKGKKLPNMFTAAFGAPGYSLKDSFNWMRAFMFSTEHLYREMMAVELDVPRLEIPAIFVQGDLDLQAPLEPLREYFQTFEATFKQLIVLEGEGHTVILSDSDRFGEILRLTLQDETVRMV